MVAVMLYLSLSSLAFLPDFLFSHRINHALTRTHAQRTSLSSTHTRTQHVEPRVSTLPSVRGKLVQSKTAPKLTAAGEAALKRCLDPSRPTLLTSDGIGRHFNLTSCAVVGAAPDLAFLNISTHIDAHGTVFRLNSHKPTPLLGNRTDVRVSNNFQQFHGVDDARLRIVPAKSNTCTEVVVHPNPVPAVEVVSASVVATLSKQAGIRNQTIPSTGALAVYIAMQMCRTLTVFGFSGLSAYDRFIMDEKHDWAAEVRWLEGLARAGRLRSVNAQTLHAQLCASIAEETATNSKRSEALAEFAC